MTSTTEPEVNVNRDAALAVLKAADTLLIAGCPTDRTHATSSAWERAYEAFERDLIRLMAAPTNMIDQEVRALVIAGHDLLAKTRPVASTRRAEGRDWRTNRNRVMDALLALLAAPPVPAAALSDHDRLVAARALVLRVLQDADGMLAMPADDWMRATVAELDALLPPETYA